MVFAWTAGGDYRGVQSLACGSYSAAEVLKDGIGQCNTKSTLLMALLRAVNIPCRLHASKVTKDFQKGATSGIIAKLAPHYILHTWVEVYYGTTWVSLEGLS